MKAKGIRKVYEGEKSWHFPKPFWRHRVQGNERNFYNIILFLIQKYFVGEDKVRKVTVFLLFWNLFFYYISYLYFSFICNSSLII